MKLAGQSVTLVLTDEGREILALGAVDVPESSRMIVSVEETEDLGIWIRIPREGQMHFFLLRWEYVLGIDLQSGTGRLIGIRS
jgi:hypothetical protein